MNLPHAAELTTIRGGSEIASDGDTAYALIKRDNLTIQGAFLPSERVQRRLAAVLAADVAGYSRLMGLDEERTLAQLKTVRKTLVDPTIAAHRGRIVKTTGDGMLVEFASAVDAARCAIEDLTTDGRPPRRRVA